MKRRLLSFAVLLMTVWGMQDVFAQLDVTDYITNADFTNGKTGWTDVSFNDPGQNPKVYEAYAGWGSLDVKEFSIKQEVVIPAGEYRLDAFGFYRQGGSYDVAPEKSLAYFVAGGERVLVKTLASEVGGGEVANDILGAAAVFAAGKYVNSITFTLVDEQAVAIGFEGTFDAPKCWFIGGPFKLYAMDDVARKNSVGKVRKDLESVVGSYSLPAGFMKTVEDVYSAVDALGASDEDLAKAVSMLTEKKAETIRMIEVCKDFESYRAMCVNVKDNSVEKVDKAIETFNSILTLTNFMKDKAENADKIVELKGQMEAGYREFVFKAVPNEGYAFDYTFLIDGIGNSTDGWVKDFTGFEHNYQYQDASNKNNGDLVKQGYIEAWNADKAFTGTLLYTKANLPTGVYTLSAYAFRNNGAAVNFIGNGKKVALEGETDLYTNPTLTGVEICDGTLTLGLEMVEQATWIGITNVRLEYTGMLPVETLQATLAEARNTLQAMLDAAKENKTLGKSMQETVETALAETAEVGDDAIAVEAACTRIIGLTATVNAMTAEYVTAKEKVAATMYEYINSTEKEEGAKAVLMKALTTASAALESALSVEELQAAVGILEAARQVYVVVAVPTDGHTFDYTFRVENASFETGEQAPWEFGDGGDTGVKKNADAQYNISNADGDYIFNTWGGSNMYVQQTVAGLPDGLYRLTALVASDADNVVTLTAGMAKADVTTIGKGAGVDVTADNVEVRNGELFVKVSSSTWFKADNFRLEYKGKLLYTEVPEAITPAEGDIESIPLPVIITPSGKYSVINGVHDGDYVESLNCPSPYLQKKGSEERIEVASVAYGSGNDIELYFVDDNGEPLQATVGEQYELVIPEGLYSCPDNKEDWESYILSGPQNKEIRCEYTIVEHIVGPNIQAIGIDPDPENAIETVSTFTLAFDQPVTINTSEDAPAVYLMSRLSGLISATVSAVEGAGQENQILITLEKEVVDAGMYMLVVPEKVVLNANGDWNASVENLTYTVVGRKVETTNYQPTGITPAEGEVTSLKSFVLQFQKETFAVTNVDSKEEAYLINNGTQEKVSATLDLGEEYNEIKVGLVEEVTAKGSYTLVIPAMMIQEASDSWGNNILDNAPELRYDFTVVEGQGIDAILAKGQKVDVYTVGGVLVKKAADREALKTLKKGLYIINGKGVLVK